MNENNFLDKNGLTKYTSELIKLLDNKYDNKYLSKDEDDNKIGEDKKYYYYLSSAPNNNGNNFMYDDTSREESGWFGSIGSSICNIGFTDYNNLTFILNNVEDANNDIIIRIGAAGTGSNTSCEINNNTLDSNNSCTFIIKNFNNNPINIDNIYIGTATVGTTTVGTTTFNKIIINSINQNSNAAYFKYTITNLGYNKYLIQQDELGINTNPVTIDETESELPEVNE